MNENDSRVILAHGFMLELIPLSQKALRFSIFLAKWMWMAK